MSRGSALWEEKGPPSTLSPCPRRDQRARLDVIFISQLRVASSITKARGRLQELLPSGDFIFSPAHQPQKREPTLQTEAACPSPSWQPVRCSDIIRLIKSSLSGQKNLALWLMFRWLFAEYCILLLFVVFFSPVKLVLIV